MQKKSILFCGDSLSGSNPSGLAYVSSSFMKRLDLEKYNVGYCTLTGQDSNSEKLDIFGLDFKDKFQGKIKVYNTQINDREKSVKFNSVVEDFKPDIVISITDIWNCQGVALCSNRHKFFYCGYITIETPDYSEYCMCPTAIFPEVRVSLKMLMSKMDLIIPVAQIGRDYVKRMELSHLLSSRNIYNGLDTNLRCTEKISKKEIFNGIMEDNTFMFFTMGKNSIRKKMELIVESFNIFLNKYVSKNSWDNYKFYMHLNPNEIAQNTDLGSMVTSLDLLKYIIFPKDIFENKHIPKEELYKRYAASDCAITLSGGEGFNYLASEACLHNKPIIYSDWCSHTEYLKDYPHAYKVPIASYQYANNFYMKWAISDVNEAARLMYEVVKKRNEPRADTFEWVKNTFDWDTVIFPAFIKEVETAYEKWKAKDIFGNFNLHRVL